jgi:hypothetical protein
MELKVAGFQMVGRHREAIRSKFIYFWPSVTGGG